MVKKITPAVSKPRPKPVPPWQLLLSHEEAEFVDRYATNGFNAVLAGEEMHLSKTRGGQLLRKEPVQAAIEWRRQQLATNNADKCLRLIQEYEDGALCTLNPDDKPHFLAYKARCMHDLAQILGMFTIQVDINATITTQHEEVLEAQKAYSREELRILIDATRLALPAPKL